MNDRIKKLLLAASLIGVGNYGDFTYTNNQNINECLLQMYFYMMADSDQKEMYFQEFSKKYQSLTKEQQKIVQQDFIDIVESQEKNKEKVKRKE